MKLKRPLSAAAIATGVILCTTPASAVPADWAAPKPVPVPREAIDSVLRSVTVVSPNDVWAVGGWTSDVGHSLAIHWDGSAWTLGQTPDDDAHGEHSLNAVDAVAGDDVWAVGWAESRDGTTKTQPLMLHYDGSTWTEQPGPPNARGELIDVDMLTDLEGWAVGTASEEPVILRRSLGQWSVAPLPPLPAQASLASVFAVSPTDAWAAGSQIVNGRSAGLVLHWNGLLWTVVTVPGNGGASETLSDIAAASATDIWAVGLSCTAMFCRSRVLHLSGGTWRSEAVAQDAILTSVLASSPGDVWVFGQVTLLSAPVLDHIEHWDGKKFTVDLSAPPADSDHHTASALAISDAAADPGGQRIWTVGWIQEQHKSPHILYHL